MDVIANDILFEIDGAGAVECPGLLHEFGGSVRALFEELFLNGEVSLFGSRDRDAFAFQVIAHGVCVPDVQAAKLAHHFLFPLEPACV